MISVDKTTRVHGLLFQNDNPKGLVFYLHGNAGSNSSWGTIAGDYLENGYDFFILDYRGYGKSEGKISGEQQLFRDIQIVYDTLKRHYPENQTVIIGYSIGTGPATYLASINNPRLLILKAPYYNLPDLASRYFKIFPPFLIRYKFRTDIYIQEVKCPVVIFHGDQDEIIYTGSSYKLRQKFKASDKLIVLKNQLHNGMSENPVYLRELGKLLNP
jgi:alpha-beta hydrolase superfamily lysophospholipase